MKMIVGKRLELIDEERIQQFWFQDDGYVSATLGTKDGGVCNPILRYEILGEDSLRIIDENAKTIFLWKDIVIDGNELRVTCNNVAEVYGIVG